MARAIIALYLAMVRMHDVHGSSRITTLTAAIQVHWTENDRKSGVYPRHSPLRPVLLLDQLAVLLQQGRSEEVPTPSTRVVLLRDILGQHCFDHLRHAGIRRAIMRSMACQDPRSSVLALCRLRYARRDFPVPQNLRYSAITRPRNDARLDPTRLSIHYPWTTCWNFVVQPTSTVLGIADAYWWNCFPRTGLLLRIHSIHLMDHPIDDCTATR